MAQEDSLIEIPISDWPILQNMFKQNWPEHHLPFTAIGNHIRLKREKKTPETTKLLSLNGDWSDGTFILVDGIQMNVYTLEKSCDRLKKAMLLHDWSHGSKLHPYHNKHREAILFVYQKLGLNLEYDILIEMYWKSKEDSLNLKLKIPGDVYLKNLQLEHAEIVNSYWPHAFEGSAEFLRELIRNNSSCGVFGKKQHDLRAWVLKLNNGIILALQTHPDHLRKGYGTLVLNGITKAIVEEGYEISAYIVEGNIISIQMFEKAGFQKRGSYWLARNFPTNGPSAISS